jgi:U3 small nucleolar ribonucleoprotein component
MLKFLSLRRDGYLMASGSKRKQRRKRAKKAMMVNSEEKRKKTKNVSKSLSNASNATAIHSLCESDSLEMCVYV